MQDDGGLALRLTRDLCKGFSPWHYTAAQVVELVVNRRRTVVGPGVAYVWASVVEDEGELTLDVDLGAAGDLWLPGKRKSARWNFVSYVREMWSYFPALRPSCQDIINYEEFLDWLLQNGVWLGDDILFRCTYYGWTDYFGECDEEFSSEIVRVISNGPDVDDIVKRCLRGHDAG